MFANEILAPSQATGDTAATPPQTQGAAASASAPSANAKSQSIAVGVVWAVGALLAMLIGRAASE